MHRRHFLAGLASGIAGTCALGEASRAEARQQQDSGAAASRARRLIRNGYVVTLDPKLGDIAGADVLIEGNSIAAVGRNLDNVAGAEVIDATGKIVMPGLINCHQHVWSSILRSFYARTATEYSMCTYTTFAPRFTPEDVYVSVLLGACEMIASGVTTVVDTANNCRTLAHADANIRAYRDAGIRAAVAVNGGERQDIDGNDLLRIRREHFEGRKDDRLALWYSAAGPQHAEREVYLKEWAFARDHGFPIQTHVSNPSRRPIRRLAADHLLGPDVYLVHAVNFDADDIAMIRDGGSTVSCAVISEMLLGRIPQLVECARAGIPLSLGIDVLGVSDNADMFAAMRMAVASQRARFQDVSCFGTRQVLDITCRGGAVCSGWAEKIGTLAPGRYADLIAIRTTDLNMVPLNDPVGQIVYAAQPSNVDLAMVNGEILKRNGRLTKPAVAGLAERAQRTVESLQQRAGFRTTRA